MTVGAVRRRSVLRQRDVAILVVASAVSVTGDSAALIALTLRLHAHGSGGWAIAALLLAGSAPMIVLSPLAGGLADRVDSRTAIATSALAQAACAAMLAHVTGTAATLVLVALLTSCGTVIGPSVGALLPRAVPADRLVEASAHLQTAFIVGNLAGPTLGGLLTGAFGSQAPLLLDAVSFLAIAVGILFVRTRRQPSREPATAPVSRSGVRVLWDDPVLRAVVTSMTLLILACGAINVAEVFLVKDVLHTTDTVFGIVSASWMAGMIAGSAATPRFGHDVRRLLTVMAGAEIVLTVGLIGAGVAPVWPLAAAAFVVGGVGNGALSVACRTIVTLRVPDALRGRAFGVMTGAINGASVLAFASGGALVNAFGARAAIVGCGCAALAVALVFVGRLHRLQPATAAAAGATQELSAAR